MAEDLEDFKIGKKLPYRVPDDFFSTIPDKTLRLAKERASLNRKKVVAFRAFTLLAAAATILLFVLLAPHRERFPETKLVAESEKIEDILQGLSDEELSQLIAMYRTDELVDVLTQESININ